MSTLYVLYLTACMYVCVTGTLNCARGLDWSRGQQYRLITQ